MIQAPLGVIAFHDNTHLFYLLYKKGKGLYNGVCVSQETLRKERFIPMYCKKEVDFYYGSQTTFVDPGVHSGHPC